MKITKTPDMVMGALGSGNAGSVGGVIIGPPNATGPGQGLVSSSSNTASWQPIVSTITSNGSNVLLGPNVNFSSGSNIIFSVSSNTLFIHSLVAPTHSHTEYLYNTKGGIDVVKTIASTGSSETLDLAEGNIFDLTLDAATVTLSVTGYVAGSSIVVIPRQDSTGGRLATWWAGITWSSGSAPVLPAGPNEYIHVVLTTVNGSTWDGFEAGGGSSETGYWETVTNGNSSDPECTYADGDIVVSFVET